MENLLRVGVISNTHGVRGEVKVFPTTDDSTRYKKLKKVILDTGKEYINLEIQSVRFFKNLVILKFKGIDTINDIEKYKGMDLLIPREEAVPLEENEYFIYDIIDAEVVNETGDRIGHLKEVLTTGANDVYVVETEEKKEILLPVIDECILDINIEEKKVVARILPGLVD